MSKCLCVCHVQGYLSNCQQCEDNHSNRKYEDGYAAAIADAAKVALTADPKWEEYLERNAGLAVLKSFEQFVADEIQKLSRGSR